MGRKAGHLALGIGKAAGATLTLVPEEFGERIPLPGDRRHARRRDRQAPARRRRDGVAVIAEGVVDRHRPGELAEVGDVERDEHGHPRLAEIDIGQILKRAVQRALASSASTTTIVSKNVGYELRCADPIPYDMEYTRDLGYCAAQYLLEGGQRRDGVDPRRPVRADSVRGDDRPDHRAHARPPGRRALVALPDRAPLHDPSAASDFADAEELESLAQVAGLSPEAFRAQFEYVTAHEPAALRLQQ